MSQGHAPVIGEEQLRKKYWDEDGTIAGIADELGTSYRQVHKLFDEYGIEKRGMGGSTADEKVKDEDYLKQAYNEEYKSLSDIADECGCSRDTVADYMDRFDIDRRGSDRNAGADYRDGDMLYEKYVEQGMSADAIGDEYGVAGETILRWLKRNDIKVRKHSRDRARIYTNRKGYEVIRTYEEGSLTQVQLHRLICVAAGKLDPVELSGRDMHVHHKNHIEWDNRPENLEVLTPSEHKKHHANT